MSYGKDPMTERKPDTERNAAGLEKCMERQRVKEEHLHPLKINERITILVPREKCNNERAEAFRKKVRSV